MKNIVIKPVKPNKRVINSKHCIGCDYRNNSNRINNDCKSCGNWNDRL